MLTRYIFLWSMAIIIGFFTIPSESLAAEFTHHYPAQLTRVVDADTMDVELDMGLGIKMDVRLRIKDYDAPETWRPTTTAEEEHGKEATAFATNLLPANFFIRSYGWAVHNRVEADIMLGDGSNFADVMIANGFEKKDSYPADPEE